MDTTEQRTCGALARGPAFAREPSGGRFFRRVGDDGERVNRRGHQIPERIIHEPMPGQPASAGEGGRDDHHLEMAAAAVPGPRMPGMVGAVVEDFQALRSEAPEALANGVRRAHAGYTCLKGLTVTLPNTPWVT